MIGSAQQHGGPSPGGFTIRAEANRSRIIDSCSAFGALGWVIAAIAYELLLGPHIRLLRAVAIGTGIGALTGLLVSSLQWSVLRRYSQGAGWWVVATTAGYTLGGLLSSLLLYPALIETDFFRSTLAVQGVASSAITGLMVSLVQTPVLRTWIGPALTWRSWLAPLTVGSGVAPVIAWLAGAGTLALLAVTIGVGAWPIVIAGSYAVAGLVGSVVYRWFLALGFRRVLPPVELTVAAVPTGSAQPATTN